MKIKNIVTVVLLIFVAASVAFLIFNESGKEREDDPTGRTEAGESSGSMEPAGGTDGSGGTGHKVIAYYLHGTKRCTTCRKIEAYTAESIKTSFSGQLASGKLEFHVLNVDEPQNRHFIYDYKLTTKSVILADYVDGEQTRWKNLDRIWQNVKDKQIFIDYIRDETKDFLGELMYE